MTIQNRRFYKFRKHWIVACNTAVEWLKWKKILPGKRRNCWTWVWQALHAVHSYYLPLHLRPDQSFWISFIFHRIYTRTVRTCTKNVNRPNLTLSFIDQTVRSENDQFYTYAIKYIFFHYTNDESFKKFRSKPNHFLKYKFSYQIYISILNHPFFIFSIQTITQARFSSIALSSGFRESSFSATFSFGASIGDTWRGTTCFSGSGMRPQDPAKGNRAGKIAFRDEKEDTRPLCTKPEFCT